MGKTSRQLPSYFSILHVVTTFHYDRTNNEKKWENGLLEQPVSRSLVAAGKNPSVRKLKICDATGRPVVD